MKLILSSKFIIVICKVYVNSLRTSPYCYIHVLKQRATTYAEMTDHLILGMEERMEDLRVQIEALNNIKVKRIMLILGCIITVYLLISIYFMSHFFFRTEVNGINLSLKAHSKVAILMKSKLQDYQLQLLTKDGKTEIIHGQEIELTYKENNSIADIIKLQNPFCWISSLVKHTRYYGKDVFSFNQAALEEVINNLNCLKQNIIKPRNVSFHYHDYSYSLVEEVEGNQVNRDRLTKAITSFLLQGKKILNLEDANCYDKPKYTQRSPKTLHTGKLLNTYASAKITYVFGKRVEVVDGNIISQWLSVDDNLDIDINHEAVLEYLNQLSKKYDSVGKTRSFHTSTGKTVEIKGGLYGWKMNRQAEKKELLHHIIKGEVIRKEPIYLQRARSREDNEIGDSYVEINITKQHLWFYKEGKLITQGPVVTGNPNRGNATVLGAYMINYKQKNTNLKGPGYNVKVSYWMPFYGNIGLHDASWRSSFGGEIYKSRGTHGCVNAPLPLAKKVFENIEEGIPVISYEE
jgi:uncharacterized surface protein with fasciclin (FAS1) repeats